jgi:oligopeptide transport system permease protein
MPEKAAAQKLQDFEQLFQPVESSRFSANEIVRSSISFWGDAWRRLRKNPVAMASLVIIFLLVALAVIGPYLFGYDIVSINARDKNLGMSPSHWFGTDNKGRDLFSNVWMGLRVSLIIAAVCGVIQIIVGCLYGGIMAYVGGKVDAFMMRIIEVIASVPSLLIVMIMMMVLGNGILSLLIAISITSWCDTARQIRGQVLQLRQSEYILAAEVLGASPLRLILKHFLPNTLGIIIINLTSSIPNYIFLEAGLSFIGLGLQAPSNSLGTMISSGQTTMDFYPTQLLFPCLVLCAVVLAFNLLGDGLRNALDPKLRQ